MLQSQAGRHSAQARATRCSVRQYRPGMGVHGKMRCLPIPVGFMRILGLAISFSAFLLAGVVLLRGMVTHALRRFPLFYSYLTYVFCGSVVMYSVYWFDRPEYASAYWFYFLVSILVEFAVLVEISDHIFQRLPALRQVGRAMAIAISAILMLFYILPVIIWSSGRRPALLGFELRSSVTKAIILVVLFMAARHYRSELGKNLAGLMLGFSIYLGVDVANTAAVKAFHAMYSNIYWAMAPLSFALALLVWTIALWNYAPVPTSGTPPVAGTGSRAVALELTRFDGELSKILHK
jgi:hypothetical protein